MKKKIIAGLISITMACTLIPTFSFAADTNVNIDNGFRDANFARYIAKTFDKNGDGYLSKDETSGVTTIDITKAKRVDSVDGIECFKDLKTLKIPKGAVIYMEPIKGVTVYEGNGISLDVCYNNVKLKFKTRHKYTGKSIKPEIKTFTVNGKKVPKSKYTIKYLENKEAGIADLKITAKKNSGYSGTILETFEIYPKTPSISKTTVGKGAVTVKMRAKVSSTHGQKYQVAYKVKGTSKWKYKKSKNQTIKIKSLKKGKKYQIKVRALAYASDPKEPPAKGNWSKVKTTSKIK